MSIPGRNSTAATLVRTGFVVVLVLVNVSGFRPVLARSWHGAGPSAWARSGVPVFLTLLSDELFALWLYPAKLGGCYYEGRRGGDCHEGTKPDLLDAVR